MRLALLSLGVFLVSSFRLPASPCMMTPSYDVQAEQALDVWPRGERRHVTLYAVDDHTGAKSFCTIAGYCYSATVTVNGRRVVTLRMAGCRIVPGTEPYDDLESASYRVEAASPRVSAHPFGSANQ